MRFCSVDERTLHLLLQKADCNSHLRCILICGCVEFPDNNVASIESADANHVLKTFLLVLLHYQNIFGLFAFICLPHDDLVFK